MDGQTAGPAGGGGTFGEAPSPNTGVRGVHSLKWGGRWGAGDCSRGQGRAPPWAGPPVWVASRRPPAALPRRARLPLAQDSPPPPRPVRPSGGGVFNSAAFCSPKWPSRNLRPPNLKPRKIDGFSFFTKGLPVVTAQRPRGKRSPRHRRQRGRVGCRRSRDGGNAWQCRGSTRHCETPHGPRSRRPRRVLRALYSHVIGGSGGRTPAVGPRAGSCGRTPSRVRALRDGRRGWGGDPRAAAAGAVSGARRRPSLPFFDVLFCIVDISTASTCSCFFIIIIILMFLRGGAPHPAHPRAPPPPPRAPCRWPGRAPLAFGLRQA